VINLYPLPGPLHRYHQDLVDSSLPEELRAQAFADFSLDSHDAASLARGRAAWQGRVLEAHGLVSRYIRFSADLTTIGVGAEFLGLASRAVWDRNCHLELCCRMVQALGGTLKLRTDGSMLSDPQAETSKMRVLLSLIGPICVEETISIRILSAMARNSEIQLVRDLILRVASDEAIHWRMGWVLLESLWNSAAEIEKAEVLESLEGRLQQAQARFINPRAGTRTDATKRSGAPSHPFGALDVQQRTQIVSDSMQDIAERLTGLGMVHAALDSHAR
jgi:hypothetical protein